jgi:glycosyltransferase involved in cell wall biosynthesis
LLARGVEVTLGPWREGPLKPEWNSIVSRRPRHDRLGLVYDFRTGPAELHGERVAYYYMWETTVIPAWQVEEINAAAALLYTPCREGTYIARANGVKPPVRVLHHGVDAQRFPFLERPRTEDDPFTFGTTGVFTIRKGIDVLVRAFLAEFAPDEPVRLLLKHTYGDFTADFSDDPRIVFTRGFLDDEGLLDYYRRLDAYVLPSRGEGFGLTGLEAMATGLPLVATNWSGPMEYLDPADTYPLRCRLEETGGAWFQRRRQFGLWAEPDVDHLRELMRYLYEHRPEGIAAGRRASHRAHRDWTWGRVAEQLIADFDVLAAGLTPESSE